MSFHVIDPDKTGLTRGILPLLEVSIDFTNDPTNPTRVWTDVTTDVRSLTYSRSGRNDVLSRTATGTLTGVFGNSSGNYDPTFAGGAYYPGVKRMRWLRVRAQWSGVTYARWQGLISSYALSWPSGGKDSICTIQARDALTVLQLLDLSGQTFSSQSSSARVAAVCTLAGLSSSVDGAAASTLVAVTTPLGEGSSALSHVQSVEDTENGRLFAAPDGTIVFQGRHYRILNSATSKGTIGDSAGEIPYRDATYTSDDANIWNDINVTPTNADGSEGTTESASSSSSKTSYFERTKNATILSSSTTEALANAQYLAALYGNPDAKLPPLTLLPQNATVKWPTVLAMTNGDRFTWKRRPAYGTISTDGFVEQISESIAPDHVSWMTSVQMLPADDQSGWLLGNSTYGLLGSTTRLVY